MRVIGHQNTGTDIGGYHHISSVHRSKYKIDSIVRSNLVYRYPELYTFALIPERCGWDYLSNHKPYFGSNN